MLSLIHILKHCIVAENVVIGENAVVGAMPTEEEQGVATIGPDVCVGTGAKKMCIRDRSGRKAERI